MQNLSGARSKVHELNRGLTLTNFDIVLLVETWFNRTIINEEITASTTFSCCRGDRSQFNIVSTEGGGVAILVRGDIPHIELPSQRQLRFEHAAVQFQIGSTKHIAALVYLSPTSLRIAKTADLCEYITGLQLNHADCIIHIFGDMNFAKVPRCQRLNLPDHSRRGNL